MISVEEAKERILSSVAPLAPVRVPLPEAWGRYVAESISAPIDLPVFDNSAMDGYAVRSADLRAASESSPIELRLIGRIGAGERFSQTVTNGTCVRIFTGSVLPDGADAVIMQEDVTVKGGSICFVEPAKPFANVRLCGEDVRKGTVLAEPGDRMTATRSGLLGAAGVDHLRVHGVPKVALLATGDELMEAGELLRDGKIYESNRVLLAGLLREAGISASVFPIVPDDLGETERVLRTAFAGDEVVITTGGVSVGEFDFVKAAFQKLGGVIDHWKVAIRPGKPFVYGQWNEKILFGLPGNPVSALVTFLILVRPALLKLSGARAVELSSLTGELTAAVSNRGDRRHFMRAHFEEGKVTVLGPQSSHMLGSLGDANCLLEVPPGSSLESGAAVRVQVWAPV